MSSDPYFYPGTKILRNRLGLIEPAQLDAFERLMTAQRIAEGAPSGAFDLDHLRAIHRHLFQDVYDWAGELRATELAKGGQQFMARAFIARGMADVSKRIAAALARQSRPLPDFATEAGRIIGDLNFLHPFREGNGRTQLQFLQ